MPPLAIHLCVEAPLASGAVMRTCMRDVAVSKASRLRMRETSNLSVRLDDVRVVERVRSCAHM
jgi:hypothetical protein